jgi:hypothetical protein
MSEENEPLPTRSHWPTANGHGKKVGKNVQEVSKSQVDSELQDDKKDVKDGKKPLMRPTMKLPMSAEDIVANMMARELLDPTGPLIPASPTIELLAQTVATISSGGDITPFREHLERVSANKPEKSELILCQLDQINDERIPRLVELQDNSERVIVSASRRGDINVSEALIAWKLANQEMALILKAKHERAQPVDGRAAVEKISTTQQQVDRTVAIKWEYTSPQGREIIRKELWELKREISATQTTTTQTIPAEAENPA